MFRMRLLSALDGYADRLYLGLLPGSLSSKPEGASWLPWRVGVVYARDAHKTEPFGDLVAPHEIGHLLGRCHVRGEYFSEDLQPPWIPRYPFLNGYINATDSEDWQPFDIAYGGPRPNSRGHADMMTYEFTRWPSAYTYAGLSSRARDLHGSVASHCRSADRGATAHAGCRTGHVGHRAVHQWHGWRLDWRR